MAELSDREKLQRLIPHWIEHNRSHACEFSRWSEGARACGATHAGELLESAAEFLQQAEAALSEALQQLGGADEVHGSHHRHDA